jgi:hypothetical protein
MEYEYYYGLLIIFSIFVYLIVTDSSIATYFVLIQKLLRTRYEIFKWWIFNNPRNPIVKYMIYRRSLEQAEEILKSFEEPNK